EFGDWYRSEHARLLAAMTVMCADRETASDLTAEAFARAFAAWKRVANMESPTGWTYRVAVNLMRRRARRAALETRVLHRVADRTHFVPASDAVEIWDAVRALPPRERTAIALRYAAGLPEVEVAKAMGVAPGTASAALTSARRKLAG